MFDVYFMFDIDVKYISISNCADEKANVGDVEMVGVRQFDEDEMLEHALEVFWQQGFALTTMPALAHATGVQRGSLYNAYGDKEAIFLRALDLYAERFFSAVRASLLTSDADAVLPAFFRAVIANMTSGRPQRGCLTTKTANDGSISPRIRARLRELQDGLIALVENRLKKPDMRLRLAVEPLEAAQVILVFTRGLAVMERLQKDRDTLAEAASVLIRSLLRDKSAQKRR